MKTKTEYKEEIDQMERQLAARIKGDYPHFFYFLFLDYY